MVSFSFIFKYFFDFDWLCMYWSHHYWSYPPYRHGRYGHMAVAGSLPTDGWPSRSYGTWVPNSGRTRFDDPLGLQRNWNISSPIFKWSVGGIKLFIHIQSGLIKLTTHDRSHLWNEAGTLNVLSHRHLYLQSSKLKMKLSLSLLNLLDRRFVNLSRAPHESSISWDFLRHKNWSG